MRPLHYCALGGVLLMWTLLGCEGTHKIRLAAENWPGNGPLFLGHYLQYYDQPDCKVDVVQLPSVHGIEDKLVSGEFDGVTLTLVEAEILKSRGFDIEILFPFDYSDGADGLVAQREFQTIQDLKGKRIGAELRSVSHYVLLQALEHAGMSVDDVEIVNVNVSQSAVVFAARDVDAVATWEPALSEITRRFDANLIFSSRDIPKQIVDVLVVTKAAMRVHPDLAERIASGWDRALDYWHANDSAAIALMAAGIRLSPEEFRAEMEGISLLRSDEMSADELYQREDDVRRFLASKGMAKRRQPAMVLVPNY